MARRLSDRAEREAAVDPGRSFIVQSPAGSGKTELLIQRFLRLLATVDRPQRVLAITFTRKATQEMADRILRCMTAADAGREPQSEHERYSVKLARAVLKRDRELGWDLLHNPAQLQIHTIDGLCARIAARGSQSGRGVAAMRIAEEPRPLYEEAARRVIERVAARKEGSEAAVALESLLIRLRGSFDLLQAGLVAELGLRDQWLGRFGAGVAALPTALRRRQEEELRVLEQTLGTQEIQRLTEAFAAAGPEAGWRPETGGRAVAGLAVADSADDPGARVLDLHRLFQTVAISTGLPMAAATVRKRFADYSPDGQSGWRDGVAAVCAAWRSHPPAAAMFQRFVKSPPLDMARGNDELLAWMHTLLLQACADLRVLFSERGVCDFQHVAELAMEALGEDLAPGEALLLEDGRLEHILVDEFQDTSRMQFRLLRSLTAGWTPGDGRTLFLVGDPMQSIYRFRKADVALFQRVFANARLGGIDLQPLRLTTNFRSCPEIVSFANKCFPAIFTAPTPVATGAVNYVPVAAHRDSGGRVVLHPNPNDLGAEGEAEQVAALATRLAASDPELKIGVLARARKQLEPVADALCRQQTGFEAVGVTALAERPLVNDLMTLTRAILHPADRVAWLGLLHAPWCGLGPAELLMVAGERFDEDILARLQRRRLPESLDVKVVRRLELLRSVMEEATASAGRQELHRRVEAAWIRLQGPCAAAEPVDLADASAFLELLARVESERPEDLLTALEHELVGLRANSRAARIQLMTIHKAKGLEFDVVLLPGLGAISGRSGAALFRQHEFSFDDGQQGSVLAPVNPAGDSTPSLYGYLGALDREEEICESQRILYVALTRARKELHLFGRWKLMGSGKSKAPGADRRSFLHLLWPAFAELIDPDERADSGLPRAENGVSESRVWPQLRLAEAPQPALAPVDEPPIETETSLGLPDRDALALGDALHQWLELIHDHWSDAWLGDWHEEYREALESSLLHSGARPESLGALYSRLRGMLRTALADAGSRNWIQPPTGRPSLAEAVIYRAEGQRLSRYVLDRLLQDEEGRWQIVDYKTGEHTAENQRIWRRQLTRYREVLAGLADGAEAGMNILQVAADAVSLSADLHPAKDKSAD